MTNISSIRIHYGKFRNRLFNTVKVDHEYWARKGLIPLGTKKPYKNYPDPEKIPESEIIFLKFDPVNKKMTERKAFNILVLGGSGDGKSLMIKNIWSVLHYAKYHMLYIDPKSTDSGRAKQEWNSEKYGSRIAPKMPFGGIKLTHFLPKWATRNYKHMVHNFKTYALRLTDINEIEMWQGLGLKYLGASTLTRLVNENKPTTINELIQLVVEASAGSYHKPISPQTVDNIMRVLTELEDYGIVSPDAHVLDLWDEWEQDSENTSVCVSYNRGSTKFMTFDIGLLIKQCAEYYFSKSENQLKPVMFIFDDASFYADDFSSKINLKFNYALHQITYIGNNYRSYGLNNILAVQTLGIIDDDVSQTYRVKLISPAFIDVDNLHKTRCPNEVIYLLKNNMLTQDKENHNFGWVLVDESNKWTVFFPFTPPCNHFEEVYTENRDIGEL